MRPAIGGPSLVNSPCTLVVGTGKPRSSQDLLDIGRTVGALCTSSAVVPFPFTQTYTFGVCSCVRVAHVHAFFGVYMCYRVAATGSQTLAILSPALPGWCWAEIHQLALVGSSSSLHSEACNALGASDGVIHRSATCTCRFWCVDVQGGTQTYT